MIVKTWNWIIEWCNVDGFSKILHQFTPPKTNMPPEKKAWKTSHSFWYSLYLKDMLVFWGVHFFRYIILHFAGTPKITAGIPSYNVFHMTKTILRQKKIGLSSKNSKCVFVLGPIDLSGRVFMSVFPYHEFIVTSRFSAFFQCFCTACARLVHADVANVLRLSRETMFVLES